MGARNRTYQIPIPCSELFPKSISEIDSYFRSDSNDDSESGIESGIWIGSGIRNMSGIGFHLGQLAPETESESTPELELALEWESVFVWNNKFQKWNQSGNLDENVLFTTKFGFFAAINAQHHWTQTPIIMEMPKLTPIWKPILISEPIPVLEPISIPKPILIPDPIPKPSPKTDSGPTIRYRFQKTSELAEIDSDENFNVPITTQDPPSKRIS